MRQLGHDTKVAVADPLAALPGWEIGDDAVRGLGRWRLAEIRLRREGDHDGLVLFVVNLH